LKENALIATSDDGRYCITAKGVDQLEADDASQLPHKHLLAAVI